MQTTAKSMNKINLLTHRINFLACVLMCMWFILPFFRVRAGVSILLLIFGIWLVTTDLKWLTRKWSLDLIFVGFFFLTFIPYFITGNIQYGSAGPNIILVHFPLFFVGIFINHYYMYYKKDYETLGKIALMTLVFFAIGSIQTYIGLTLYPMASRILATGVGHYEAEKLIFNRMGVGGFGYIYASTFIFLSVVYLLIKNNYKLVKTKKIIVLITFISLLLMILEASYAIAIMIILSGGLLILTVKNKKMLVILMVFLGILLLLIPPTFIGEFFLNIANIFSDNYIINEKFTDLGMSFLQDSQSSQTDTRLQLYTTSFNTFLRQPLFGIYGPMGNLSDPIGAHSGWLDLLGFYGLFSGIPLFLVFYYNFKKHFRFYKKDKYYGYLVVIYFLFLVFGTINPVLYVYEVGFIIFMIVPIIPLISKDFGKKKVVLSLRGVDNENTMDN